MSKAIDVQKRRNAKAEPEPTPSPLGFAAHGGPPGLGAEGRQQPGGRPNTGGCDLRDGYKCPHKLDDASPCDVHSANVTQARCKDIIDDPPYKLYVDTGRKRSNNSTRSTTHSLLKSKRRNCASTINSKKVSAPQKAREAMGETPKYRTTTSNLRPRRTIDRTGTAEHVGPGPGDAAADAQ